MHRNEQTIVLLGGHHYYPHLTDHNTSQGGRVFVQDYTAVKRHASPRTEVPWLSCWGPILLPSSHGLAFPQVAVAAEWLPDHEEVNDRCPGSLPFSPPTCLGSSIVAFWDLFYLLCSSPCHLRSLKGGHPGSGPWVQTRNHMVWFPFLAASGMKPRRESIYGDC